MATKLNPAAAEFVPGSFAESYVSNWGTEDCSEDHITPQELAEIEAAEEWVQLQSELEEQEESHLIAVALRYAPQSKVAEIQKRCGLKPTKLRVHKGIRTRGAAKF